MRVIGALLLQNYPTLRELCAVFCAVSSGKGIFLTCCFRATRRFGFAVHCPMNFTRSIGRVRIVCRDFKVKNSLVNNSAMCVFCCSRER